MVLTGSALLERCTSTFEVVRHQALSSLAAVVRFWEEPQWLALEWTTGRPATLYVLPGRDALLTATLHAAQVGRCSALGCRCGLPAPVWCPTREPGALGASCRHFVSRGGLAKHVWEWLVLHGGSRPARTAVLRCCSLQQHLGLVEGAPVQCWGASTAQGKLPWPGSCLARTCLLP